MVLFQWSNLDGDTEKFGENEIELFERVRAGMRPDFCDAIDIDYDPRDALSINNLMSEASEDSFQMMINLKRYYE